MFMHVFSPSLVLLFKRIKVITHPFSSLAVVRKMRWPPLAAGCCVKGAVRQLKLDPF